MQIFGQASRGPRSSISEAPSSIVLLRPMSRFVCQVFLKESPLTDFKLDQSAFVIVGHGLGGLIVKQVIITNVELACPLRLT
jgi:hypothetical protein